MTFFNHCEVCGKTILGSDEFGCQCTVEDREALARELAPTKMKGYEVKKGNV